MKTNLVLAVLAASGYAFLFTACESKEQKAKNAELEHQADAKEDMAKQVKKDAKEQVKAAEEAGKTAEKMAKDDAKATQDAIKDNADAAQKQLKDEADKIRDEKK